MTFVEKNVRRDAAGRFDTKPQSESEARLPKAGSTPALSDTELDEAARSAVMTMLWASPEAEEAMLDGIDVEPAEGLEEYLRGELADFANAHPDLIREARDTGYTSPDGDGFAAMFGHDFILTREHEGSGFWDREPLETDGLGERLTVATQHRGDDSVTVETVGGRTVADVPSRDWTRTRTEEADTRARALLDGGMLAREVLDDLFGHGLLRELSYAAVAELEGVAGR